MTPRPGLASEPTGPVAMFSRDSFLSDMLAREAGRVHYSEGTREALADSESQLWRELAAWGPRRFVDAVVPVSDLGCVAALEDLRFRLIDTNVQLDRAWDPPLLTRCPAGYDVGFPPRPIVRSESRRGHQLEFSGSTRSADTPGDGAMVQGALADNFFSGERGDARVGATLHRVAGFLQLIAS